MDVMFLLPYLGANVIAFLDYRITTSNLNLGPSSVS